MTLLLISFLSFWAYFIYTIKTVGIQKSITNTQYYVKPKILFKLFIIGVSVPIIYWAKSESILMFWAGIFLLSIVFVPNVRNDSIQSINHVIGASGGISLGFISIIVKLIKSGDIFHSIYFYSLVVFLLSAVIIMYIVKSKNRITWIEVFACNLILIPYIIESL